MPKHQDSCLPPQVLQINNQECPILFHKVTIPAEIGDDESYPPKPGLYRNTLLVYEANHHVWMYSSDGIPTFISDGGESTIDYEELINKPLINGHELIGDSTLYDIGVIDAITTALVDYTKTDDLAAVALSGDYNDLLNKPTIPTKTSDLINDSDFVSDASYVHTDNNFTDALESKLEGIAAGAEMNVQSDWDVTDSSSDAFIKNKPTIPTVNDATLTIQKNGAQVATFTANSANNTTANITVPTTTSELTNNSGFITNAVDDLVNYYTKTETDNAIAVETGNREVADQGLQQQIDAITASSDVVDIVGTYTDLQNYDTTKLHDNDIIKVLDDSTHNDATAYYRWDTDTSAFSYIGSEGPFYTKSEADAEFVPQTRTVNGKALSSDISLDASDVGALPSSTVIPTVNDATLTIQKNGTNVTTFTANSATNATANIAVPVATSELNNDSGFITSASLPTKTSDLTNDGSDGTSTYVEADDLATVATSGSYNDLSNKPTIPAAQVNSDWDANSGVAQILNKPNLATVATSGSYNDLTDKPTIDFELVEMSYGESNAWAKFIAAYQGHKIVYCRASSNSNPATGSQTRKAFMAYVNNADNPTEVEFQYVRSVSTKTSSQPVDQVYVYKLTSASGGTWTVQTRDMGPKLAQGTNTTVSYSNGTYTISATQPTVPTKTSDLTNDGSDGTSTYVEADDLAAVATSGSYSDLTNKPTIPTVNNATLTIQKNSTDVATFTANASSNVTANIAVPTATSDLTNDSGFITSITKITNAEIDAIMGVS